MAALPNDAGLAGLAQEYLELIAATQGGHGDPDDRPHAASYRTVVHDQILQALGLTRDGGWQRFVDSAAIEHNARKLGLKAGFTDEFADQQPGYRQS